MTIAECRHDGSPANAWSEARRLRREGRPNDALAVLRTALRQGDIGPDRQDAVGGFIQEVLAQVRLQPAPLSIQVLGQCNTRWLSRVLTAQGWAEGMPCLVQDGAFDNILQELEGRGAGTPAPDVLVFVPWNQRLLEPGPRPDQERVESEIAFWQQVWAKAKALGVKRQIQVGYDWVLPGARGYLSGEDEGGDARRTRLVNDRLRATLPPGMAFVPLQTVSGILGRQACYDLRNHFWTRQPFSQEGTLLLARHLTAALRALTTGPKKVLAVDLDNTLWGGVVGEVGPAGITLGGGPEGEAYCSFQRLLAGLKERGILLAVCSKNNPEDAREPFTQHPEMILKLDDFAAFAANWKDKATNLREIARQLNLGLDSFVFFDDNPAEREQVRLALPEVTVAEVPRDPADYGRCLLDGLWFESLGITEEDRHRADYYLAERQRRDAADGAHSLEDYLRSLNMTARVEIHAESGNPPSRWPEVTTQRVLQLLGKTNQFNLTTRRHSPSALAAHLAKPGALGLALRLRDKFGDHGLVAVALGIPVACSGGGKALLVDTFLMSCRVIGRTVEHFLWECLKAESLRAGFSQVRAEYLPTAKNAMVRDLWDRMGLTPAGPSPDDPMGLVFEATWADLPAATSYVQSGA